ncbi:hypothetical protein RB195_017783 [Necator americanus]|uniref:Reverse transcriptase domain-containing protein n=1 Tax=Necator americanus TaxID=51031 RepID=A0ABR1C8V1_NECAM
MRKLEWDDMGVKIDGRQLHPLHFADDIVLITPSISQAERMLTEFDETRGCIGLQLNLQKTMFMRNIWVSDAPLTLNGTNISECASYVYLGRELNMMTSPLQHHRTSCFDLCWGNLGISQAGRKRSERH